MNASLIYLRSIFWMLATCILTNKTVLCNAHSLNTFSDIHGWALSNNKTTASKKEDGQCGMVFRYLQCLLATNPIKYSKIVTETLYFLFNSGWLARRTAAREPRAALVCRNLCTNFFVQHLPAYLNTCMLKLPLECLQHTDFLAKIARGYYTFKLSEFVASSV